MKTIIRTVTLTAVLLLTACSNTLTKSFGGAMTVELEQGQKLVNASWKGGKDNSSLWILTRVRKETEAPETYQYFEKSTYGLLEGRVTIIEK